MFSIFERKPAAKTSETAAYDWSAPIPRSIAVTADIIEHKLDTSRDWASDARAALDAGNLSGYIFYLCLAKETVEEATALMESADLLHEEILNRQ